MRNYLLITLCLTTLISIAIDVLLLHPRAASAQAPVVVKIQRVTAGQDLRVAGDVVGFSCSAAECYVATKEK